MLAISRENLRLENVQTFIKGLMVEKKNGLPLRFSVSKRG